MEEQAKLVFDKYQNQIGWDYGDGEGINCYLGECLNEVKSIVDFDERDVIAAELALEAFIQNKDEGWERSGSGPWIAPSAAVGRQALAVCKAAIKVELGKKLPLTEWEQKALNAGWKPPKGRL